LRRVCDSAPLELAEGVGDHAIRKERTAPASRCREPDATA
jgi:hypothetical protein